MKLRAGVFHLAAVLACCLAAAAQEYEGRQLVTMKVVADTAGVEPGASFRLGVLLEMEPGWHTYWENPGDAGLPTTSPPLLGPATRGRDRDGSGPSRRVRGRPPARRTLRGALFGRKANYFYRRGGAGV